jgi:hypothetical protein
MRDLKELFRDGERTEFIAVASPTVLAVAETRRLIEALEVTAGLGSGCKSQKDSMNFKPRSSPRVERFQFTMLLFPLLIFFLLKSLLERRHLGAASDREQVSVR